MRISDWSSDVCSSYLSRKPQHHFLGHFLHRSGKIHLALGQWVLRLARRHAKQPVEGLRGKLQTGAVIEIFLIEPERPERKSVVKGKRLSGRVDLGGGRTVKQKKKIWERRIVLK